MQKVADVGLFALQPSEKSAGAAAEEPRQEHPSKKDADANAGAGDHEHDSDSD
jgi:hypothetical protein